MNFFQRCSLDHPELIEHFIPFFRGQLHASQLTTDDTVVQRIGAARPDTPLPPDAAKELDRGPGLRPYINLWLGVVPGLQARSGKFRVTRAPPVQRLGGGRQFFSRALRRASWKPAKIASTIPGYSSSRSFTPSSVSAKSVSQDETM